MGKLVEGVAAGGETVSMVAVGTVKGGFVGGGRSEGGEGDASAAGAFAGSGVGALVVPSGVGDGGGGCITSGMPPVVDRSSFRFRTTMRDTRTAKMVKKTKNKAKGLLLQPADPASTPRILFSPSP